MHIVSLKSENIKRLQAVEITPDGKPLVIIGGQNAQGKSSVLDSIAYALAGKGEICARPVRDGEESATIILDLDDLVVTRTFTGTNSYLRVSTRDGASYSSPQAILDKLVGTLSFDPLEFSRLRPELQMATLQKLVGLDFTDWQKRRAAVYDDRTQVNRELKRLESQLASMPVPAELPELEPLPRQAEVSFVEISQRLTEATQAHTAFETAKQELAKADSECAQSRADHVTLEKRIEALKKELEEAETQYAEQAQAIKKSNALLLSQGADLLNTEKALPDLEAIRAELASAEQTNAGIRRHNAAIDEQERQYQAAQADAKRQQAARQAVADQAAAQKQQAETLTATLEQYDAVKAQAIAQASFPVPGLAFDESGVTYGGIPLAQASTAEKLRVSVAMGLAMNPKLKVILIRDGSLLDAANLAMIGRMAEEAGAQIWIERVGEGDEVSVVIEDGLVKGAELPAKLSKRKATATV